MSRCKFWITSKRVCRRAMEGDSPYCGAHRELVRLEAEANASRPPIVLDPEAVLGHGLRRAYETMSQEFRALISDYEKVVASWQKIGPVDDHSAVRHDGPGVAEDLCQPHNSIDSDAARLASTAAQLARFAGAYVQASEALKTYQEVKPQ